MRFILCFCSLLNFWNSCSSQKQPISVEKIYDSKIQNYVAKYRNADPAFFNNEKDFWVQYSSWSVLGIDDFGIKYVYDFEKEDLIRVNGLYETPKKMILKYDFTGAIGFNFYFDETRIGWLTLGPSMTSTTLRVVDIEASTKDEKTFNVPHSLLEIEPIIVNTTSLLFNNYLLHVDGRIDTLKVDKTTTFPADGDKVFMHKNAFMIDKYSGQKNPNVDASKTNPIDFNQIEGNRLTTRAITSPNGKTQNYRIECGYRNVWLLSHKSNPEKFCLYDTKSDKLHPFELDKKIFNLDNLSLADPVSSDETSPGRDVIFSYFASMNADNLYIYVIKNGIEIYKVSEYGTIMK
ncbi:MAG TPA: hypothetical protein VFU05_05295 [Cyclobacteriaceae bacterium]|nr:hypothetical protein [Cyclobacteriaceae bacterium]